MVVKSKETVEVEIASVDSYKSWAEGDILRIVVLYRMIEKDFPDLDRVQRMRAVETAPYKVK